MGFYDDPANVDSYEKMCEGYDGSELYNVLSRHLEPGSSMLELGTGPGADLRHFQTQYEVTGSDLSEEFLKRGRLHFPDVTFHQLDAVTLNINQPFDCIFSNKVLHHLNMEQLEESFRRQTQVIRPGGLFAHTFWMGDKEMTMHGMYFLYHNRERLLALVNRYFEVIDTYCYSEFEDSDSLFVLARNNR